MFTFTMKAGLIVNGTKIIPAYSGAAGIWKNNPDLTDKHDLGAIPLGLWYIGTAMDDVELGPCVMRLTPATGTDAKGRTDFLIHGDSKIHPGFASKGCIVSNGPNAANDRTYISKSLDRELLVTE